MAQKRQTKNLLPYFYGVCLVAGCAYLLELSTVSHFLFLFAPAAVMLFVIMHQDVLQKNIIALKNIIPAKKESTMDWTQELIRSCLVAMNNNESVYLIIEHTDALAPFIKTDYPMHANLHQTTLELLTSAKTFTSTKMIWVHSDGTIRGINASWHDPQNKVHDEFNHEDWVYQTQLYSAKTDSIGLWGNPEDGTFLVIASGELTKKVHSSHALQLIKKHTAWHETDQPAEINVLNTKDHLENEGVTHATQQKEHTSDQHTS